MAASFSLLDMDAMACGLVEARQWQDWARQPKWPDGAPLPATPAIPPMMARRMSPAIRMAVYNACGVWINEFPFTPARVLAALKAKEEK